MAELSIPWPDTGGVTGDGRKYTAGEWADIWEGVFQEQDSADQGYLLGVGGELAVTAPAANTIRVATGKAFVRGHYYINTANNDLTPASAPGGQTRKDRCVLRCDWVGGAQYTVAAVISTGDAVNYPALTQVDDNTWDIPLARYVIDDAGAITGLTDDRVPCYFNSKVATAMLDDLVVTAAKLAANAVTTVKITDLNVTTDKLAAGAVTAAKTVALVPGGFVWYIYGDAEVGKVPFIFVPDKAITITGGRIYANTAPTGASLILDIHSGAGAGTTIWTTQGNRPTLAATNTGPEALTAPDVTAIPAGTVLALYVDQIGSTLPGSDVALLLAYTTALV